MSINTSKKAVIAQSLLLSLTGSTYNLRTLKALAKEAGATESDTLAVLQELGVATKRRRSDGATLYGIAGRAHGNDVVHTPVAAASCSAPVPAASSCSSDRLNEAKGRVVVALESPKWKIRSRNALKLAANVNDSELDAILRDLQVYTDGQFIGLRSRRG